MKTTFLSFLALAACPLPAFAGDPVESDWASLDSEINRLSSSLRPAAEVVDFGGLFRGSFSTSEADIFNIDVSGDADRDRSGFFLNDATVWVSGPVGEQMDWRISLDVEGSFSGNQDQNNNNIQIEDAYGRYRFGDAGIPDGDVSVLFGSFKSGVTRSTDIDNDNLFFFNRTFTGQLFEYWDEGAMVEVQTPGLRAFFAVQNGSDRTQEEKAFSARFEGNFHGGTGPIEGAFGAAPDNVAATAGIFWYQDGSDNVSGRMVGADASVVAGAASFHFEVADFHNDVVNDMDMLFGPTLFTQNLIDFGNKDPKIWAATGTFEIIDDVLELGLRVESLDDEARTKLYSLGGNWYHSAHNAKVFAGIVDVHQNNSPTTQNGADGALFQVGLTVGSFRSDA